ncbi:hypothetical protein Tco_0825729 [Tanacetum coccineum]
MNTTQAQQKALDDALVASADRLEFEKCNMRLKTDVNPKEATFQVVLDALALTPFYRTFLITADVPAIYMQEFWATVSVHKSSIRFMINKKKVSLDRSWALWRHQQVLNWQRNWNGQDSSVPCSNPLGFTKIIIDYFMSKDQSILRRNKMFWHTTRDDTMFTSMRCIFRHEDTQVYGTILPKELTNQAMLESNAYKTYYTFASREKAPKPKYVRKKADPDTSPKQKPVQATKGTRLKSKAKVAKPDKKKQPAKMTKAKGLTVLSEVALTETEQLKLATKRRKTQFHSSHASGSSDGVDTQSKVPDEQQQKSSGTNEGTDSDKEDDFDDDSDDNDESDDERTESDKEKIDDEELMDEEEDEEVTKELYDDVNVNLGNKDADMTNADQVRDTQKTGGPTQSSSVSSDFTSKLLNLDNPFPADNEIAYLMDTIAQHATTITEITSSFTITVPPLPPFFNPLSQQATPTPTPTASDTTTSLPALPDFASVFKFNERVFNLEKDVSEIKQVDQYA